MMVSSRRERSSEKVAIFQAKKKALRIRALLREADELRDKTIYLRTRNLNTFTHQFLKTLSHAYSRSISKHYCIIKKGLLYCCIIVALLGGIMKVVPVEKLVNKSAIETLDEMRVLVESGEVVALAIATVTRDGGISGDVSSGPNQILMWSSLQHMTHTQYDKMIRED